LVTTELAVLFPIIVVILLSAMQLGLWAYANSAAQAAADHGAEVAATYPQGSAVEDGRVSALNFVHRSGLMRSASAEVVALEGASPAVTVTVRAEFASLFGLLDVRASSTVPFEQLEPDSGAAGVPAP